MSWQPEASVGKVVPVMWDGRPTIFAPRSTLLAEPSSLGPCDGCRSGQLSDCVPSGCNKRPRRGTVLAFAHGLSQARLISRAGAACRQEEDTPDDGIIAAP